METPIATVSIELALSRTSCCTSCPGEASFALCEKLQKESSKYKVLLEGQRSCGGSFCWTPIEEEA